MPSTFFGLDIGTTGLHIYQQALNTTSHNITNTKTEGYSRQQLNRQAGAPIALAQSYGMVGTGVAAHKITQLRDSYYDYKYRSANNVLGEFKARGYYLNQIQNYLNELNTGGFNTNIKNLFNGLQEIEKDPTSVSARAQLVNLGFALTDFFNNVSENIKKLQDECNFTLKNTVETINSYGDQIATLTKQINIIEVNGGFANDLRDQRNVIIDKLSEIANISVVEEKVGMNVKEQSAGVTSYTVKVNGRYLVNNYTSNKINIVPRKYNANLGDVDGLYDLEWADGQNFDLYSTELGGKLAALVKIRDGNNRASLQGKASIETGDTEIVIKNTNINSVEEMNFPPQGKLVVGSHEYEYESFQVDVVTNDETGKKEYVYTFKLKEGTEVAGDLEDAEVRIGRPLNFKGIPYYMDQLNLFVRKFAKEFNEIHKQGKDLNGNAGIDFFNGIDKVSGENYTFKVPGTKMMFDEDGNPIPDGEEITSFSSSDETYYRLIAGNFSVTGKIRDNVKMIASGSDIVNGIENRDIVKKLKELQHNRDMFDDGKPEEFYQALVSDIAVDTKTAHVFEKNQTIIVKNINNQRLSISGVDSDEEAMDLVKFKHCYDLSAKVISVMNEVYNKLINEMAI